MPAISCTGSPPIICHPCVALIILEKNIFPNIVSSCLQKHNHPYIESNIITSSYKFSLSRKFSLIFFLLGRKWRIPQPIDITPPVCLRMFVCTSYDVSTHVNKSMRFKTPMILTSSTVWFRYDMHLLILFQSSTLLFSTLVVKNYTAGSISDPVLFVIYINLAVNELNKSAFISSNNFASYFTSHKCISHDEVTLKSQISLN